MSKGKFIRVRVKRDRKGRFERAYIATRTPSGAISRKRKRVKQPR